MKLDQPKVVESALKDILQYSDMFGKTLKGRPKNVPEDIEKL